MQRPLQWYQSLDLFVDVGAIRTQGVVGVDILCCYLPTCTLYLDGMVRLKRPGPTLLVHARETGSTIDMQLVLHKWLAGVCFSSHGEMRFAMEGLSKGYKISNFYITVVVLRRLERFYLVDPSHVKIA